MTSYGLPWYGALLYWMGCRIWSGSRSSRPDRTQALLRLSTGFDVDTHAHVRTVGGDSKFGLDFIANATCSDIRNCVGLEDHHSGSELPAQTNVCPVTRHAPRRLGADSPCANSNA